MEEVIAGTERVIEVRPDSAHSRKAHILSLDGFRGLAVLLVVSFHVIIVTPQNRAEAIYWHLREPSWIGVEMFFTLSGFLITGILLRTVSDPHYLSNFYLRRTLRIFPLYYGVLAILFIVGGVFHLSWNGCAPYLLLYIQNFRTAGGLQLALSGPNVSFPLYHFWSLAVEEQFYLVWPFLVLWRRGSSSFIWVPLFFIVLCPVLRALAFRDGLPFAPLRYWTIFRVDSLAWGGLAAVAQKFFTTSRLRMFRWATVSVGGLLTLYVLAVEHGYLFEGAAPTVHIFYSSFGAFCSGLILVMVHGETMIARFFRMPFLRWFGRYSYGIYIIHLLFMGVNEKMRSAVDRATGSQFWGALVLVASAYGLSAGLAWLSYHGYESYFLGLKDKVAAYSVSGRISRR